MRTLLAAADDIGTYLCRESVWYDDCCTWFTALGTGPTDDRGLQPMGVRVPDGSSGVILVLARLFSATGDDMFLRVARAGTRHVRLRLATSANTAAPENSEGVVAALTEVERRLSQAHRVALRAGGVAPPAFLEGLATASRHAPFWSGAYDTGGLSLDGGLAGTASLLLTMADATAFPPIPEASCPLSR